MYAVIEAGGKQYRVQEGDVITVEKIKAEVGETVTFNTLLISAEGEVKVGAPYLNEVVTGTVVEHGKGQKVIIFKYKAKKDYRKKQGHRQPYTMVKIEALGGAAPKKEAVVAEEVKEAKKVSASMKKDELIAFAKENNIEIDERLLRQLSSKQSKQHYNSEII